MQQIYISLKSGNPVTIVPNSEDTVTWAKGMKPVPCVTVQRIDCDKQLLVLPSNLQTLEDFLAGGGELGSANMRIIEFMQRGA